MNHYEVVIVGAGFAGLSCAETLAKRGHSVLVCDKKTDLSHNIHTTGIIVDEALEEWDISENLLRPIGKVKLYLPNLKFLTIASSSYRFYLTDTGGVLKEKAKKVEELGVKVQLGSFVKSIQRDGKKFVFPELGFSADYLVAADGAKSILAQKAGFTPNPKYLAGIEYEYKLKQGDVLSEQDEISCFIHPNICKGYIGWVAPSVESIQVGLAVEQPKKLNMDHFLSHISSQYDFSNYDVIERRSGLIPVGGTQTQVFKENFLLLGDAAGTVSPLTAGGIHPAMRYGRTGGDFLSRYICASCEGVRKKLVKSYGKTLPSFRMKHGMRSVFNLINRKWIWSLAYWSGALYVGARMVFFLKKRLK